MIAEFPEKWNHLSKKIAYPHEHFKSIDEYQKPVKIYKKGEFFNLLKHSCPSNEEFERTKEIINLLYNKTVDKTTTINFKSDVNLFTCVFEKLLTVPVNDFDVNRLFCVSSPGFIFFCGLKYTGINLQTLKDKELIWFLENFTRGGISSISGDGYVKSDDNKKVLYIDATIFHGWAMSESLPFDEIQFIKNIILEDILSTPDDSDTGYFVEIDLGYPNETKKN